VSSLSSATRRAVVAWSPACRASAFLIRTPGPPFRPSPVTDETMTKEKTAVIRRRCGFSPGKPRLKHARRMHLVKPSYRIGAGRRKRRNYDFRLMVNVALTTFPSEKHLSTPERGISVDERPGFERRRLMCADCIRRVADRCRPDHGPPSRPVRSNTYHDVEFSSPACICRRTRSLFSPPASYYLQFFRRFGTIATDCLLIGHRFFAIRLSPSRRS
jgi:hypothetical protein